MTDPWAPRLSEYLDGDLPAGEVQDVEAHLAACASCTRELEGLRRVKAGLAGIPAAAPPERVWQAVRGRIERRDIGRREALLRVLAYGAAAAALAALIALWWIRGDVPPGSVQVPAGVTDAGDRLSAPSRLYGSAVTDWREALRRQRTDPDLDSLLASNLEPFDRAIEETRDALRRHPEDDLLREHHARLLKAQVRFLRHAGEMAGGPVSGDGGGG